MVELDIEALKRLDVVDSWGPQEADEALELWPAIIAALEDRERLRAEIQELRGLGWEHLKRDRFPLIRAALEGRDG